MHFVNSRMMQRSHILFQQSFYITEMIRLFFSIYTIVEISHKFVAYPACYKYSNPNDSWFSCVLHIEAIRRVSLSSFFGIKCELFKNSLVLSVNCWLLHGIFYNWWISNFLFVVILCIKTIVNLQNCVRVFLFIITFLQSWE